MDGALEGPPDRAQGSAPECRLGDSSENERVQSTGECTRGADSDARTKGGDVSALRIEEAMKALAAAALTGRLDRHEHRFVIVNAIYSPDSAIRPTAIPPGLNVRL